MCSVRIRVSRWSPSSPPLPSPSVDVGGGGGLVKGIVLSAGSIVTNKGDALYVSLGFRVQVSVFVFIV
jgi:hypothetical protein